MTIYNTLTGNKEELKKPFDWLPVFARLRRAGRVNPFGRKLKLFVCGPTVYDEPHIGNARTFVAFDLIVRILRSRGYKLRYLMNITNIDDKIIARAKEQGKKPQELADEYEVVFRENMGALNATAVDEYARATDFIPQITKQIQVLIKKGHVYNIENVGWYFDLTTYPEYGTLSHRTTSQADDGVSRIDDSDKKRNKGDFCVWKLSKQPEDLATLIHAHHQKTFRLIDGEPAWESPLGWGRPGWHIEDTAISSHFFGPQYDIHGGALDLKFPHHEAEIALQESASGKKPFVNLWMHPGFLTVDGAKMSKSKGNFVTTGDLLAKHSANAFRMLTFSAHYRSPLDYTETSMAQAAKNFSELRAFVARLRLVTNKKQEVEFSLDEFTKRFDGALADDLNTPGALAALFDLMNAVNQVLWQLSVKQARQIRSWLIATLETLGFTDLEFVVPEKVLKLAAERELSRVSKQFAKADDLRMHVKELGYDIEDTPAGALVLPAENPKSQNPNSK